MSETLASSVYSYLCPLALGADLVGVLDFLVVLGPGIVGVLLRIKF